MKACPRCKLINPADADRCDCGYEFSSGEVKASYLPPPKQPDVAKEVRVFALALIALNTLALVVSDAGEPTSMAILVWRPTSVVVLIAWSVSVYYLAIQFGHRKRWARTALAILTLPMGLLLFVGRFKRYLEDQPVGP